MGASDRSKGLCLQDSAVQWDCSIWLDSFWGQRGHKQQAILSGCKWLKAIIFPFLVPLQCRGKMCIFKHLITLKNSSIYTLNQCYLIQCVNQCQQPKLTLPYISHLCFTAWKTWEIKLQNRCPGMPNIHSLHNISIQDVNSISQVIL